MATYAALSFKVDFLKNLAVEDTESQRTKDSKKQYDVLDKLHHLSTDHQNDKLDKRTISVFAKTLRQVEHLKHSIFRIVEECFCRQTSSIKRTRKLKAQVFDKMEHHLDIRSLVKTHEKIELFLRLFLTPH